MIPTHVIEKAIAGGWKWNTHIDCHCDCCIYSQPDFWQALGKEMGWNLSEPQVKYIKVGTPQNGGTMTSFVVNGYHAHAKDFYDLILRKASPEDITHFWKSL